MRRLLTLLNLFPISIISLMSIISLVLQPGLILIWYALSDGCSTLLGDQVLGSACLGHSWVGLRWVTLSQLVMTSHFDLAAVMSVFWSFTSHLVCVATWTENIFSMRRVLLLLWPNLSMRPLGWAKTVIPASASSCSIHVYITCIATADIAGRWSTHVLLLLLVDLLNTVFRSTYLTEINCTRCIVLVRICSAGTSIALVYDTGIADPYIGSIGSPRCMRCMGHLGASRCRS